MYLSDNEIRERLSLIDIETYNQDHPFDSDVQIQPCSIDIRLSDIFWQPISKKTIDLRKSVLLEASSKSFWKRIVINQGEHITLKPGEILLGRTYEKFSVPDDCAAKIEGRSSFARLGLSVHCTGDFINPGYRGHMPLQLLNCSPNPIKLFPFIPISQLVFIQLTSIPTNLYGIDKLQHKYMDDFGGPSLWWRDDRIKKLQNTFQNVDISTEIQNRILEKIGVQEPEIIERMQIFIGKSKTEDLQNADSILENFIEKERIKNKRKKLYDAICYGLGSILASTSIGTVFLEEQLWQSWSVWGLTAIILPICLYRFTKPKKTYLIED